MTQNLLKTGLAVCLAFAGAGMSWADGWQRCTTVADVTAGGKFVLGYETIARSGKIIPMKNTGGTATTTAAGYMANGAEIDMATVSTTTDYEVTIQASTAVTGAVCIKVGDNFIGNTDTKNNCKLFAEESATTAFGVTVGTNDVFTFKIAANSSYHTLQYNANSPRFACYGGTQKNLVAYKWVTGNVDPTPGPGPDPVLPKVYASLSELVADGTPTTEGVDVTVTLTNEVIKSFYTSSSGNKNGVFLDVNGQEIEIYCYDVPTTWVVGGKISGTVTCPWKLYKSTWELCPAKWNSFTYTAPEGGEGGEDGIESDATLTWNLAADETATVSETFMAWNHANLTMNVEQGGSTTPTNNYYPGVNNYSSTRFYKGSQFTLAPVGSEIVAAEFFATTTDYATNLAASAWVNATAKADKKTVTVTPTDGTKAMSAKIGKTTGFTSVKVYYNNLDVVTIDLPASEDIAGYHCNYATFSSDKDVIFDEEDIFGVYAIDVEGEDVVTVDFEESTAIVKANDVISGYYVPANTGVVLMHFDATTKYYVVAADAANELTAAPAENKLRAASVAMTGDYNFYKFAYNDYAEKSNLGFYWGAEEGAAFYCKPGTAYLALDKAASSNLRGLSLNGNGVVTAIESVAASKANTVIFNLQGQRVSKLQKGVNIVNGKKVIR